jgi:hypothetical protein
VMESRVLGALSQLVNTLIGGHPNESISARCHRQGVIVGHKGWRRARKIVNWLFFWEADHCYTAYLTDVKWAKELINGRSK